MVHERSEGEMVHTSKFKSAKENAGKRILVVGAATRATMLHDNVSFKRIG